MFTLLVVIFILKYSCRNVFESLNLRKITDDKKLSNTGEPLSNKGTTFQKISLKEGQKLGTDDSEITNMLYKQFVDFEQCLAGKGGCSAHVLNL